MKYLITIPNGFLSVHQHPPLPMGLASSMGTTNSAVQVQSLPLPLLLAKESFTGQGRNCWLGTLGCHTLVCPSETVLVTQIQNHPYSPFTLGRKFESNRTGSISLVVYTWIESNWFDSDGTTSDCGTRIESNWAEICWIELVVVQYAWIELNRFSTTGLNVLLVWTGC